MTLDMPRPISLELNQRLASVVLLAGALRPRRLSLVTGRAIPELPLEPQRSILRHWQEQLAALAAAEPRLSVRVMINEAVMAPALAGLGPEPAVELRRDPRPLRGTGGLLRDIAEEHDDHEHLLVAAASRIVFEPIEPLLGLLLEHDAPVRVLAQDDGTPMDVYLIRCGALRRVPALGYVDFKEQALPRIAAHHRVVVVRRRRALTPPVRTAGGYIRALRLYHRQRLLRQGRRVSPWAPAFGIVEPGASVAAGAMLHDSVVLSGARVDPGAIVVRSIVGRGAVVGPGQALVDRVLSPAVDASPTVDGA